MTATLLRPDRDRRCNRVRPAAGLDWAALLASAAQAVTTVTSLDVAVYVGLHEVMIVALWLQEVDDGDYDRLALADNARDLLATYLVEVGDAEPVWHESGQLHRSQVLRGWVVSGRRIVELQRMLLAAAEFWRHRAAATAGLAEPRSGSGVRLTHRNRGRWAGE